MASRAVISSSSAPRCCASGWLPSCSSGPMSTGLRTNVKDQPVLIVGNHSVYTLMKLLGHKSMATSQRYVAGAPHAKPRRPQRKTRSMQ
jgi:hypothetical protein